MEQRRYRGLARAPRNIYTHHLFNPPVYVNKLEGAQNWPPSAKAVVTGSSLQRLLQACAELPEQENLTPLFQGNCSRSC